MSPLGKYGQVVSALVAVGVIGTYLIALVFAVPLNVPEASITALDKAAFLALGAVFGAAAAVNGIKAPVEAAHTRIDKLEVATGIPTHGSHVVDGASGVTHSSDVARDAAVDRAVDRAIDGHPPGR